MKKVTVFVGNQGSGDQTKWIATVNNDRNKNLTFTAIDKCVIKDEEEPDRGRCDGMESELMYKQKLLLFRQNYTYEFKGGCNFSMSYANISRKDAKKRCEG